MKVILLLLLISTGISLASCESEYDKQLNQAKDLVNREMRLRESSAAVSESSRDTYYLLEELQKDIAFHAHLSGNEEVFLQELKGYRDQLLVTDPFEPKDLITKYP